MIGPAAPDWDRYPITLKVPQVAEIYGAMKPDTVRRAIRARDPSLPTPFMDRPWRWRKADVIRHYQQLELSDLRRARARLRRQLKEAS